MDVAKFKDGARVRLHADPAQFTPDTYPEDEDGTVIGYEGDEMYMVRVDVKLDEYDDCLREVSEDQMSDIC